MQIRTNQFCSLATSPVWQSWLYSYDKTIYTEFMHGLRGSSGCGQNRNLMIKTLDIIKKAGGSEQLVDFLHSNYPHVIKADPLVVQLDHYFMPGLLTFPHRCVIESPKARLQTKIQEFIRDKFKYDYLIVGKQAYIEYLTADEQHIADQVPVANWILARYRNGQINAEETSKRRRNRTA